MKRFEGWVRGIGVSGVATIAAACVLGHAAGAYASSTFEWHWHAGGGAHEVVRHCLDIFWWLRRS